MDTRFRVKFICYCLWWQIKICYRSVKWEKNLFKRQIKVSFLGVLILPLFLWFFFI